MNKIKLFSLTLLVSQAVFSQAKAESSSGSRDGSDQVQQSSVIQEHKVSRALCFLSSKPVSNKAEDRMSRPGKFESRL